MSHAIEKAGPRWGWALVVVVALGVAAWKASTVYTRLTTPTHVAAGPRVTHVPIEKVRLGDRVPGENPAEAPDDRFGREVDPSTWRRVDLRCQKRDGSDADVSLLRPAAWLETQGAKVGGVLRIDVPECGIDGDAEVLVVCPCPPVKPGPGNVVTGIFRHKNAHVIDLYITGMSEPIGTTPNHKFWNEDITAFVRADRLRVGEHTSTMGGGVAKVVGLKPKAEPVDVYNLETYPWHTYHVGKTGVLVHNADPNGAGNLFNLPTSVNNGAQAVLLHGTTLERAELILKNGPDPAFVEPGGSRNDPAGGFSTSSPKGPFHEGNPLDYANGKASLFPKEGGPAVVQVEIPGYILKKAIVQSGEVRFEPGRGLEELLAAWKSLNKQIRRPEDTIANRFNFCPR